MIAYDRLSLIIPADQALANKALQSSLQQITGISQSTLEEFAVAVDQLNTTKDLPLVQAQTQVLPDSVYQYYITTFSANYGSGPNGTITLADVIGAVAGIPYTGQYTNIVSSINNLYNNGQLNSLISIYNTMLDVVDGVYGTGPIVIPSGPAAGTYTDYDAAFNGNSPAPGIGLILAAQNEISSVVSGNSSVSASLNLASNTVAQSLIRENVNQARADIVWDDLISSDWSGMLSFVNGLSNYGLDTSQGGTTQVLENVADLSILGGQALVAALRESRNIVSLNSANIDTATQLDPDPETPPPEADLISGTYTEQQARQQLIF